MTNINNPFSFLRSAVFVNLLIPPIVITQLASNIPKSSAMNMFENVSLSTVEIIVNNGYSVEVHEVVTQDGYILELHRIPTSKSGQKPTRNHPVLIHHGILGSSADWVLGGADISIPFQLADAGYDVWMANCRGNTYSRKHVSMTCKQKAYWNFSLHEIGMYDLPATIDYILMRANSSQLHYLGYSMGSCVFFIMGSERPEYHPKIRSQISLAPVAFLSNTRSSLRYIAPYAKMMNIVFQRMSKGMLLPQSKFQSLIANTLCRERLTQKLICEKCIIFSVCGSDPNFNSKLIPLIMGHFPAGTSAKLAAHFAQFILKDTFGQYDYGPALNVQHYNSTEPPTYDLKSIQVPITLIHGENDILADTEDVMRLKVQLPQLMDAFAVADPYFNHVDFLWSLNVNQLVNEPVKDILQKTDDPNWTYTGPNSRAFSSGTVNESAVQPVAPITPLMPVYNPKFVSGLDFFAENLDAIIASTMPRCVDEKDAEAFERERELQKLLFGDVIQFVKSATEKYDRIRNEFTNEVSDWSDDARTGVMTGVAGARNAAEFHVRQTATVVGNTVSCAGKTVAGGVAKAGSAVAGGVTKAENAVVGGVAKAGSAVAGGVAMAGSAVASGVAKAESAVVGGVAKAERFVVGGVVKAEHSVFGGIAKAGNFVHHGANHVDRAMGTALNVTFKALNKAFWFVK